MFSAMGWSLWGWGALAMSVLISVWSFGPGVGIAYWLASMTVLGAAVTAGVAAAPELATPSVWFGSVVGAVSGVFAWTM